MTEPAWRHIDSITEEMFQEGSWCYPDRTISEHPDEVISPNIAGSPTLDCMRRYLRKCDTARVYGPIPDPPKPPPKLRRFEAMHGFYGRVSGVSVDGKSGLIYFPPFWDGHGMARVNTPEIFADIQWIDPE